MSHLVAPGGWIYGMQLPIQTLTRTLREPWEEAATVEDLVTITRHAESTGHRFAGVCDHVAIPDNDYARHMTTTWYDTVATLAYLAGHTSSIGLLSVVWIAGYRHPLLTAKAFGTLDHLSGGRAILGVGAGHVEAEFEALGLDFKTRGKRLDETLRALRAVWDDTYVSFDGDFYTYQDVGVAPRPVQDALPIWVGGMNAAAWRRAGRFGDGYIPMGAPKEQYGEIVATISAAAEEAGRDPQRIDIGYMPGWLYLGAPPADIGGHVGLSGSADEVAADLRAARDVGANVIHMRFRSRSVSELLDQMSAFEAEVVPLVS